MRIKKVEERWFEIPGDPDKGRLKIRNPLPGELDEINEKVFSQKIIYRQNSKGKFEPEVTQNPNMKLHRELLLKATVKDWENFFDASGKPLKFSEANLLKASKEIPGFDELVEQLRDQLAEDISKEEEELRKNS